MFDGVLVAFTDRRLDSQHASAAPPWQLAVLLICCATLSVVLAILYPDVLGTRLEQF